MLKSDIRGVIQNQAMQHGMEAAKLMAVVETESAGIIYWNVGGRQMPSLRPEGHYFYRLLPPDDRAVAVSRGLAWPRWDASRAPRTWAQTYRVFDQMCEVNRAVAIMSCSWGVGQVMGSDFRKLGYASAEDFLKANDTADGQVDVMCRYIVADNLLRAFNNAGTSADSWRPFAKGYNGSGYERNAYHTKCAASYRTYKGMSAYASDSYRALVMDEKLKLIQQNMATLGLYTGKADGFDSPELRASIKGFQVAHGLEDDGIYGSLTSKAVDGELAKKKDTSAQGVVGSGAGTIGVGAIGQQVVDQVTPLKSMVGTYGNYALGLVIMCGVALVIYGLYQKWKVANAEATKVRAETVEAEVAVEHEVEFWHGTDSGEFHPSFTGKSPDELPIPGVSEPEICPGCKRVRIVAGEGPECPACHYHVVPGPVAS